MGTLLNLFSIALLPPLAFAQAPVITSVLNQLGQTKICPGDIVNVYGTLPSDAAHNFTVTVAGKQGLVGSVTVDHGVATVIQIYTPPGTATGASSLVLNHAGAASNAFPVNLSTVDPVLPLDPYVSFRHNVTGQFVTPAAPAVPGEGLTVFATGLGATVPPLPIGAPPGNFAPTALPVAINLAGSAIAPDFAGHYPLNSTFTEEDYEVSFTLPGNMPLGPQPVTITVGGVTSNPQTLFVGTQAMFGQPSITKITNGANFSSAGPFVAGSFVSIFGTGFGSQDNLSAFPATKVNGMSVLFNGVPAPIFHLIASAGQINALVPAEAPSNGTVTVVVQNSSGPSRAVTIEAGAASPGIFLVGDPSNGSRHNAAALIANTAWLVMPASQAQALGVPACTGLSTASICGQPAHLGDFIQLYVTGLGKATPNGDPNGPVLATGQPAPSNGNPVYLTVVNPVVTIGGQTANLLFSGLAPGFAGLYQVNVQIPAGVAAGDDVPVQISVPGAGSDSAVIAVGQ